MYDLILTGGLVYDGTGAAPRKANVCISGGKIAAITTEAAAASETLDVSGLAVAPGFIDIHTHCDAQPFEGIIPENYLLQGVTTQITGNCGTALFPTFSLDGGKPNPYSRQKRKHAGYASVSDYAAEMEKAAPMCNYAPLAGHSNLRSSVLGFEDRGPPRRNWTLCARRWTLSWSGILAVHMRNEGPRLFQAVEEMLDIARLSGVHLQISHLKLMGKPQWGKAPQLTGVRAGRAIVK